MMHEETCTLPKRHPATVLLTWFFSGFSPVAPGTCGSLCAIPFAWVIVILGGQWTLLLASCLVFFIGWLLCYWYFFEQVENHPQVIVIDEVAGQWLTLSIVPVALRWYFLAFILFRLADIYKPWPVSLIDRRMKNALGIMLDDIAAAIYAIVVIQLIYFLVGLLG